MTDTERKALALMDIVRLERSQPPHHAWLDRKRKISHEALCRLIDAHEAFQQEVSDAVKPLLREWPEIRSHIVERLSAFIIAKPDPLVEAMAECGVDPFENWADQLRAALAKRGLEIRERGE